MEVSLARNNPLGGKRARKRQRKMRKQAGIETGPYTFSMKRKVRNSTGLTRLVSGKDARRQSMSPPAAPMEHLPVAALDGQRRFNCPSCRRINHDVSTWGETHDCDHCGQRVKIERADTGYRGLYGF